MGMEMRLGSEEDWMSGLLGFGVSCEDAKARREKDSEFDVV
jgi:hypothetical protein